jgi:hypothetical protein
MCGPAKEWMASAWVGDLDRATEQKLRDHLETCEECRLEMAELSGLWERLADLPVPEVSQAMHNKWQATLSGMQVAQPATPTPINAPLTSAPLTSARRNTGWKFSLAALSPNRPVWQATAAAACLLLGVLIGVRYQTTSSEHNGEVARLRQEVNSTRELVSLSLLRQQSAAERLRGVDYTTRMPAMAMDGQVIDALVQAVSADSNVNVRLAAIDALTRLSGNASVRQSMVSALKQQDSPMVQAALIDYLVDAKDQQAAPAIEQLTAKPDVDPSVKQRAQVALGQLVKYK